MEPLGKPLQARYQALYPKRYSAWDGGTSRALKSKIATAGPARPARAFPRLRIRLRNDLVLGPGKIQLIQAIDRTGSISAAARELGMSYRRAWLLVDALNRMFSQLVIRTSSGGAKGGGAKVTAFGRAVAAAYLRAEERTSSVIREEFADLDIPIATLVKKQSGRRRDASPGSTKNGGLT